MARKRRHVGIDLGTTYSTIAYLDDGGQVVVVPNRHGSLLTPSVVLYDRAGTVVVGQEAKAAAAFEPERVVECVKRDMGQDCLTRPVPGPSLRPEEVSAAILRRLKDDFESQVGPISDAVITVPAYFDDIRRKATCEAGQIAGLTVSAVLNEPVAAAMAFSLRETLARAGPRRLSTGEVFVEIARAQTVLVFDLGGGTFDVTIVRSDGREFTTLATDGNVRLGGKDWDDCIIRHLAERISQQPAVDFSKDPAARAELAEVAERAKRALSDRPSTPVRVRVGGRPFSCELDRATFDELTADLLAHTELTTELVIEQAALTWTNIDKVLLVGGSTKMPQVSRMLRKVTGKEPDASLAADLAVSQGAAIYSAMLAAKRAPRDQEGVPVEELPFDGEVLTTLDSLDVRHVNSHSLGVVARNRAGRKINSILIRKNTPIPHAVVKTFGLEMKGQTTVRVTILEGEAEDPSACSVVGKCLVSDLPPGLPRGAPVRITCRYDTDGRIHVEARDMVSQRVARAEIQRTHGLSTERMSELTESVARLVIE